MTSVPTKVCTDCRNQLPLDDFYRSREYRDGRMYTCKSCVKTYRRDRLRGVSRLAARRSDEAVSRRFWAKVDKSGPNGCWLWTSSTSNGYGTFSVRSRPVLAHRLAYKLAYGDFDESLFLCHHCDTPLCVRPDHQFLGTPGDNTRDAVAKGRTHRGERTPTAKLTEAKVVEIRARSAAGERRADLAVEFGVAHRTIDRICNRTRWAHVA